MRAIYAALPLAAADYIHSEGPHVSGVAASFKADHRVTDKENLARTDVTQDMRS